MSTENAPKGHRLTLDYSSGEYLMVTKVEFNENLRAYEWKVWTNGDLIAGGWSKDFEEATKSATRYIESSVKTWRTNA